MGHRFALILGWALLAAPVHSGDLPPGASMRLGEAKFRAGGPVSELHFSPDGSELTSRVDLDERTMRTTRWSVATGLPLAVATEARRPGSRVRWSATEIPDSTRGITIGDDGVPVVRDFAAKKDLARLTGHFARVSAVCASPDGKRIATASADGFIRVWDAATFRPLHEPVGHTAPVQSLEVSPNGRTIMTLGADRTARVWDLSTGRQRRAFVIPAESRPRFSADGAAICIPNGTRLVNRDLVTGLEVTLPVTMRRQPYPLAALLRKLLGIPMAISPDGRTVAWSRRDGRIELFETASWQVRRTLVGHAGPCFDLAFTPDGSRLLSASADHSVLIWPVRVRDVKLTLQLKRETDAAALWNQMAFGSGIDSYPAMARLAADPAAAVRMARLCLKPGGVAHPVADARAVELLESLATPDARALLRTLAEEETDGVRVRESRAALRRLGETPDSTSSVRTVGATRP